MKKEEREKLERILTEEGVSDGQALEAHAKLLSDGILKEKSRKPFHCDVKDVDYILIKYRKYQSMPDGMDTAVECKFKDECKPCCHEENEL